MKTVLTAVVVRLELALAPAVEQPMGFDSRGEVHGPAAEAHAGAMP